MAATGTASQGDTISVDREMKNTGKPSGNSSAAPPSAASQAPRVGRACQSAGVASGVARVCMSSFIAAGASCCMKASRKRRRRAVLPIPQR
ncbi:MAG: hypothetical protein DI562_21705 [Stenotrophomonas acidaminiphila]|nr:MAG: hypothetical protein DI562_21705 [Stenotrophomonas acidaminiphila]